MTDRLIDSRAVRGKVTRNGKPVSDMTIHRWLKRNVLPTPDKIIEGKRYWRESVINRALGLDTPES